MPNFHKDIKNTHGQRAACSFNGASKTGNPPAESLNLIHSSYCWLKSVSSESKTLIKSLDVQSYRGKNTSAHRFRLELSE